LARRIRIVKRGSLSTVVWNPWMEKSARLGDMGQDGYRKMVCVETANAGRDQVTLAPGERHLIAAEISVETL
jgi:glucose-6-phosphate 1-epimerase